ncbi:serine protease [Acrasis kona]|uniref:Serine protease n=1 Tax=Acrasis kona TaxID=1008807 RepID=A0AAW2YT97_9EUKA
MKHSYFAFLLIIIALCTCEPEYFFDQKVDHFTPSESTFKQRYYVYDEHRASTGDEVALLYICGEIVCTGTAQNYAKEYARHLKASLVTVEHRYYGKSVPTPTLSTKDLRFLTTEQALSDLATFIQFYSKKLRNPKWIAIGCSYPGALSAWFRLKYPHLVVGALSSSGVVNSILDFWQFDDQVRDSAGPECATQLRRITGIIEKRLKVDSYHTKALFSAQNMTNPDFMYMIADAAAESLQYGFHGKVCDPLIGGSKLSDDQILDRFINHVTQFFYKEFDKEAPYDYSIEYIMDERVVFGRVARQWWYQTCVEVGWLQNYKNSTSIRSSMINMDYHKDRCNKVFGLTSPPDTKSINLLYGGDHVNISNVVYANGSQDPWKRASVLESQSDSSPLIEIKCINCGHGVDLRGCPSLPSGVGPSRKCEDNEAVDRAREEILRRMRRWLL